MQRKIMIVLIAIAAMGVMALPTEVSARPGGPGARSGSGHFSGHSSGFRGGFRYQGFSGQSSGFRGGFRYRSYPYVGAYASCWRLQYTPWGSRRVWVCGGGYPYY